MSQLNLDDFDETEEPNSEDAPFIGKGFEIEEGIVTHSLLRTADIKYRLYQAKIASNCYDRNSIVVLPTGLGKTMIALFLSIRTRKEKKKKVLLTAPTRPLVHQHHETFEQNLPEEIKMGVLSGRVRPPKREEIYKEADIVFSTPQCVSNDLDNDRLEPGRYGLLIVDEAHRTVGKYSYVNICEKMRCPVLGLTASPGGKKKKIKEVLENLRIEVIEARTRNDPDVKDYVKEIEIEWVKVGLTPEMEEIRGLLDKYLKEKIAKLRRLGIVTYKKPDNISKTDILNARKLITARFRRNRGVMFGALHNQSQAILAFHCVETLETQGVKQLYDYLSRMADEDDLSRSKRSFLKADVIDKVKNKADEHSGISHPKLNALGNVIQKQTESKPSSRIIVFTQLRDTIPTIMELLAETSVTCRRFVGQATRPDGKGLKQDEQAAILDEFRAKEFNVLIATSVAEEGLDIPDVDLVVFYEPLPSEIRNIQRRGRTGRTSIGKVKVLIAEDTRDEAYLWAGVAREKKMRGFIRWMEGK